MLWAGHAVARRTAVMGYEDRQSRKNALHKHAEACGHAAIESRVVIWTHEACDRNYDSASALWRTRANEVRGIVLYNTHFTQSYFAIISSASHVLPYFATVLAVMCA